MVLMLDNRVKNDYIISGVVESKWFRLARNECMKSIHNTRFGATLVLKNGKSFTGFNKDKSHPMIKKHYKFFAQSIHAELDVLLKVNPFRYGDDIHGSKMYIYREDKNGWIKPSHPCVSCFSIMKEYGVKKCYYTTKNGYSVTYL
jgi:cytidine deaminase